MVERKAFSIVIPAYNEEKYIQKTVDAVLTQDHNNFEIVVVPNGCTDKTETVLSQYLKDPRVKIISHTTAHVSQARNKGAQFSQGKHLIFLDADVKVNERFLQDIETHFKENHAVGSIKYEPDVKKPAYILAKHFKNFIHSTKLFPGSAGVIICKKKDFDEIGGFNEDIIVKEDSDLIQRLMKRGEYICVPNSVEVSMRRLEKWGVGGAASFWIKEWFKKQTGQKLSDKYEEIR